MISRNPITLPVRPPPCPTAHLETRRDAFVVGRIACLVVALFTFAAALVGAPRGFYAVALFEALLAPVFFALEIRTRAQIRALEASLPNLN